MVPSVVYQWSNDPQHHKITPKKQHKWQRHNWDHQRNTRKTPVELFQTTRKTTQIPPPKHPQPTLTNPSFASNCCASRSGLSDTTHIVRCATLRCYRARFWEFFGETMWWSDPWCWVPSELRWRCLPCLVNLLDSFGLWRLTSFFYRVEEDEIFCFWRKSTKNSLKEYVSWSLPRI